MGGHARTGQRKPTVRAKMRNFHSGKVIENQFNPNDTVEFVRIERRAMEYLYRDGNNYVFMNPETYEQPAIPSEQVEHMLKFLTEGLTCTFSAVGDEVIRIDLPESIDLEVTVCPPHAKGDTASSDLKPVEVSTGIEVKVPPFIKQGDVIRVNTETGDYMSRISN